MEYSCAPRIELSYCATRRCYLPKQTPPIRTLVVTTPFPYANLWASKALYLPHNEDNVPKTYQELLLLRAHAIL